MVLQLPTQAAERVTADEPRIRIEQKNVPAPARGETLVASPAKADVVAVRDQSEVAPQFAQEFCRAIRAGVVHHDGLGLHSLLGFYRSEALGDEFTRVVSDDDDADFHRIYKP